MLPPEHRGDGPGQRQPEQSEPDRRSGEQRQPGKETGSSAVPSSHINPVRTRQVIASIGPPARCDIATRPGSSASPKASTSAGIRPKRLRKNHGARMRATACQRRPETCQKIGSTENVEENGSQVNIGRIGTNGGSQSLGHPQSLERPVRFEIGER